MIEVADPTGPLWWPRIVELRRRVLRRPLGLDFTPEELAADRTEDRWFALADGEAVVACAGMRRVAEGWKVRQVAVDPTWQGRGLGRRVMGLCESAAEGWVVLHARETAVPFYLALGYEVVGEGFEEVGIPHRKMRKAVASNSVR